MCAYHYQCQKSAKQIAGGSFSSHFLLALANYYVDSRLYSNSNVPHYY